MDRLKKGISVIVCCYNSADRLPKTLEYLSTQKLDSNYPVELVIVNNNSSDNTGFVARELWRLFGAPYPISVIEEKKPGLSNARRAGVMIAQYEYGIFCDDDNWLNEDYLKQIAEIFESNPMAGVIGGASVPVSDAEFPPWFYSKAGFFAVGTQADRSGDITQRGYVWGAGMAFRIGTLKTIYEADIMPLVSGRRGEVLTSGDDGEISAWFIFSGYRLFYAKHLTFKHYMPPARLTDDYYNRFFQMNYPTDWAAYSNYLTVKYMIFDKGSGIKGKMRGMFKIIFSLVSLLLKYKQTMQIVKIDFDIRAISNRP